VKKADFSSVKTSLPRNDDTAAKLRFFVVGFVNEMTNFLAKMTEIFRRGKSLASGAGFAYNDR
jgi:hypothetical protein